MNPFEFSEIAKRIHSDPRGFVEACDAEYNRKIYDAAQKIAESNLHIVLLAGPSGSGKTTTAHKIRAALLEMGVVSYALSMDDYFRAVNLDTHPKDEWGKVDFESPYCLDIDLFSAHIDRLNRGLEIQVPVFDFIRQAPHPEKSWPLKLASKDIALFEGIHALNPMFFGQTPAVKLYVSARTNLTMDAQLFFKATWMRLIRRLIRDHNFRGYAAADTFAIWGSVRRGEKKYISPYKNNANIQIDTALPYELPALRDFVMPLLDEIPDDCQRREELLSILPRYEQLPSLPVSYIAPDSLLREFIGFPDTQ